MMIERPADVPNAGVGFLIWRGRQMKTSILSVGKTGSRFAGVVFVSAIVGAGSVGAETYQHGGSTAIIQQSGGSGKSESEVKRYKDGQTIITQDGNSTDITIQREDNFPSSGNSEECPETAIDYFYKRFIEERFSRIDPDEQSVADVLDEFKQRMKERFSGIDPDEQSDAGVRDEFKRRMLNRMRRDFP